MHHKKPTSHLNITQFVTLRHALLSNRQSRGKKPTAPRRQMGPTLAGSYDAKLKFAGVSCTNVFVILIQKNVIQSI